jgi:hypothetical protein
MESLEGLLLFFEGGNSLFFVSGDLGDSEPESGEIRILVLVLEDLGFLASSACL